MYVLPEIYGIYFKTWKFIFCRIALDLKKIHLTILCDEPIMHKFDTNTFFYNNPSSVFQKANICPRLLLLTNVQH
jgi:hypothetical protein